jgi:hypothetical protein
MRSPLTKRPRRQQFQPKQRKLKSAYPMLQIEIYDAANKIRTLLSYSNIGSD